MEPAARRSGALTRPRGRLVQTLPLPAAGPRSRGRERHGMRTSVSGTHVAFLPKHSAGDLPRRSAAARAPGRVAAAERGSACLTSSNWPGAWAGRLRGWRPQQRRAAGAAESVLPPVSARMRVEEHRNRYLGKGEVCPRVLKAQLSTNARTKEPEHNGALGGLGDSDGKGKLATPCRPGAFLESRLSRNI